MHNKGLVESSFFRVKKKIIPEESSETQKGIKSNKKSKSQVNIKEC